MQVKYLFKAGDRLQAADLNGCLELLGQQQSQVACALSGPNYILSGLVGSPSNGRIALTSGYIYCQDIDIVVYVSGGVYASPVYVYWRRKEQELPDAQRGPSSDRGVLRVVIEGVLTNDLRKAQLCDYLIRPLARLVAGRVEYAFNRSTDFTPPSVPNYIICGLGLGGNNNTVEVEAGRGFLGGQVITLRRPTIFDYDPQRPYINLGMEGPYQSNIPHDLNLGYVNPPLVWHNPARELSLGEQQRLIAVHTRNSRQLIEVAAGARQGYLTSLGVWLDCLVDDTTADYNNPLHTARYNGGRVYAGSTPLTLTNAPEVVGGLVINQGNTPYYLTVPYVESTPQLPTGTASLPLSLSRVPGVEYRGLVYVHATAPTSEIAVYDRNGVLRGGATADENGQAVFRPPVEGNIYLRVNNTELQVAPNGRDISSLPAYRTSFRVARDAMWTGISLGGVGRFYLYIYRGNQVIAWLYAGGSGPVVTGAFFRPLYLPVGDYTLAISGYTNSTISTHPGNQLQRSNGPDWSNLAAEFIWAPVVAVPTARRVGAVITVRTSAPQDTLTVIPQNELPCGTGIELTPRYLPNSYQGEIDVVLTSSPHTFPILDLNATQYIASSNQALSAWVRREITLTEPLTALEVGLDALLVDGARLRVYLTSNGGQTWDELPPLSEDPIDLNTGLRRLVYYNQFAPTTSLRDAQGNLSTIPRTRLQVRVDFVAVDTRSYFQRLYINSRPSPQSRAEANRLL